MGNLFSLHKDVLTKIYRDYLNRYDRILLLWAAGKKPNLNSSFINEMARRGELNIVKWLWDNDCPADIFTTSFAALGGNLNILKWLRDRKCPWNSLVCINASMEGHLDVLEWALKNGCEYDRWAVHYAYNNNRLEVLIWWLENWGRPGMVIGNWYGCMEPNIGDMIVELENRVGNFYDASRLQ